MIYDSIFYQTIMLEETRHEKHLDWASSLSSCKPEAIIIAVFTPFNKGLVRRLTAGNISDSFPPFIFPLICPVSILPTPQRSADTSCTLSYCHSLWVSLLSIAFFFFPSSHAFCFSRSPAASLRHSSFWWKQILNILVCDYAVGTQNGRPLAFQHSRAIIQPHISALFRSCSLHAPYAAYTK